MHFKINEAVFAYGDFLQSVIQTAFTVVALFYLVVRGVYVCTVRTAVFSLICTPKRRETTFFLTVSSQLEYFTSQPKTFREE